MATAIRRSSRKTKIKTTAAEVAIGLALIIAIFRLKSVVNVDEINILKW